MINRRFNAASLVFAILAGALAEAQPPNIVVLFADDAGYADFGLHGSDDIRTPHIDSIAQRGVRFTDAYVTAAVCSPSRAGLLTGRYQQRFGHEYNLPGKPYGDADPEQMGLPTSESTLADALGEVGYRTIAVGKWHLGTRPQFHPLARGFDEFFGILGGSGPYTAGKAKRVLRNRTPVNAAELPYLTDAFGDEACAAIERNKDKPFFLYLSFTAPHTPMQAKRRDLEPDRFETDVRAKYAAMMRSLDDNVGKVLARLKALDLEENTLVFFANDNGGAMPYNGSLNAPLAGTKGTYLEGGIRVPFAMRWPARLPRGEVYTHAVSMLDVFATCVAAAGAKRPPRRRLDGVDLIPFVTGKSDSAPHPTLYWRLGAAGAIRQGDWKLIWFDDQAPRLHNLKDDVGEQTDLCRAHPERTEALLAAFRAWAKELAEPRWRTHPRWKAHSRRRYEQDYVDTLRRK